VAPASPTPRSLRPIASALALGIAACPGRSYAFDAEVRAESTASSWQVRGPAGAAVLSLRRFTQTLSLAGTSRPDDRRAPVLRVRARLRIDSDFGTACDPGTDRCLDELNRSRAAEFAPLFARRAVDLPFAYLEVTNLARGRLDLRVGRQLVVDPLGFFLFDGGHARLDLGAAASVEAYGGWETRSGFPLSNGRYERDGLLRADRSAWDRSIATAVVDRAAAAVAGAALDLRAGDRLDARVTWRRTWSDDGVAEEAVAGRADLLLGASVRAFGEAVYMVPMATVTTAAVGVEGAPARGGRWSVELLRVRPVFDLTSVWASFWIDPTDEARASVSLPLSRAVDLSLGVWGRRYALDSESPANDAPALGAPLNAGGSAAVRVRRPRWDGALRASLEGGDLGLRGNADLSLRVWLLRRGLRLDALVSLAHVRDALRADRSLDGLGLVLGATVPLGRVAQVSVSLEDDLNGVVGHRVRAVGVLEIRTPP
jgi:hypothetical protein